MPSRDSPAPTRRLGRLGALVTLAAALGAVLGQPVAAERQPTSESQDLNVSTGSPEASSNSAGVQARWTDGGRHAALFVTGSVDLSDAWTGQVRGDGSLLLLEEVGDTLQVYEWQSRVGDALPDMARRALAVGANQLARLSMLSAPLPLASIAPTPQPDPQPTPRAGTGDRARTLPGSTLTGLPSVSDDPTATIVQAGWRSGAERFGLATRGHWRIVDGGVSTREPLAWFVVFAADVAISAMRSAIRSK